jgi:hypothetical protein
MCTLKPWLERVESVESFARLESRDVEQRFDWMDAHQSPVRSVGWKGMGWDGSYPTIMAIYKLYGILHDYGKYINITNYYQYYIWLVVSNMNFIFHNIWDVILPIDVQDG